MINEGNLSGKITPDILTPFIESASISTRKLISETVYAQTYANIENGTPTPDDYVIQKAETNLALSFSIIPLGTRSSVEGGFVDSIGFKDGETTLLSLEDLETLQAYYQGINNELIQPYIPVSETENPDEPDAVYLPDHSFHAI
jgi:hypothetical protein